ncbi:PiggyBac transposable element-derived protein 1 [Trichinella spiralis]|uniref:PiggyBac transposable element-derived protein 1 n=1 Tax=Trichinella spiralis TaxID=6334 RepID=A0A0V1BX11_TRISP|nr:PiggyBac transposable element-derived protein 1 [Trichinella spiralis]
MPKVENPVGFFSADVVVKVVTRGTKYFFDNYFAFLELHEALLRDGIHSLATMRSNRLRGCPVRPFNELKRRGRGATDFIAPKIISVDPVEPVTRWDKRKLQFIEVPCSAVVSEYKKFIRGVDFTRMLISLYRMDRSVYRCKRDR